MDTRQYLRTVVLLTQPESLRLVDRMAYCDTTGMPSREVTR